YGRLLTSSRRIAMPSEWASQRAAQAWCAPTTSDRVMDPALADVFARMLDAARARGRVAALRLGGQLIGDMLEGRIDPDPRKLAEYLFALAEEIRVFETTDTDTFDGKEAFNDAP